MKRLTNQFYITLLLLLLGITWGSGYVIARIAMLNNITPLTYSFWQSLGPALFLLGVVYFKKNHCCWLNPIFIITCLPVY